MFNVKKVLSLVLAVLMLAGVFASCAKDEGPDPMEYTLNSALSIFPDVWNNHTYETATDGEFLGYTEPGFFTFDYNENKDGYKIVPDMATKEPEDVTSQYVGQFGITENSKNQAYKITLRQDIKWEDGTPIKADDFIESLKLLLNPEAGNLRADSVYSGNLVLVGAKDYFYGGNYVKEFDTMMNLGYKKIAELTASTGNDNAKEGQLTREEGDLWFNINDGCDWSSNSLNAYYKAGYLEAVPEAKAAFEAIVAKADKDGWVAVDAEVANGLMLCTAVLHSCATVEAYAAKVGDYAYQEWNEFCYVGKTAPKTDFETVGIKKTGDYEFDIILQKPLKGFYLLYNLTGSWLVKTDLYKKCITVKDGVYNCTYGTSVETYMSYGPYKLTVFQDDKQIVLVKNKNWYGYNDEANKNLYQTTKIEYKYIKEPETAMMEFLAGNLDGKGLDANTIKEYAKSEHVYYTDGASTFFIAINPDLEALKAEQEKVGENVNKTILTIKEFRMALSFALNRAEFNLACDPTGSSGFAVFNNLIISDPEKGVAYRTTEQAKKVLAEFWGLADEIGEGKRYATIDEAIASITGYNLAEAKKLFDAAYDKAIEDNLMDGDDVVEICIGLPSAEAAFYKNGYEFLKNCYTEAVKGTKLEGKLRFTSDGTIGNDFAEALHSNQVNLLFGVGWRGSALDPFNLMEAYTSEDYQYDPSWNTKTSNLDITLDDGVTYTASVWDWTIAIMGEEITIKDKDGASKKYSCGLADEKPEERLEILAALEGAVLATYDLLPINNESSAALKGMQVKYGTEEYVYGVGRGGVKYMTYNYTDREWAKFVKKSGGKLNYK